MKKIYIIIAMLVGLSLITCKKDAEPEVLKVVFEEEQVSGNSAVIKGAYEYSADIKDIEIRYSTNEDLSSPQSKEVLAEGKAFTITLENLEPGTQYYYRLYFLGYNTKETETRSFRTEEAEMASVTTKNVTNITATSAECGGEVISDGGFEVTSRGVCWSTSQNPTIADSHTIDGSGTGSFTSQMTGLTGNTTYYVRAYATNEKGTVYGEEKSFVTNVGAELPTVTTQEVLNITINSAECGGEVISDGGSEVTARGVCWSTSQNPTIADNYTDDGNGIGSFTSQITGLTENTTYYVRAYATNEKGTVYGEERSFMTEKMLEPVEITVNGVSFVMIGVNGGTFSMGAQADDPNGINYDNEANNNEKPVHSVTLSDYYIGETEVTQELWEAVMGHNPSYFSGDQKPVEMVSWNDCQEFISELNSLTGMNFRLPTKAEWEYAARGGNVSEGYKYSGSNTIGHVAWYNSNSIDKTHNVKTKLPNELGIYDMSGNVYEWCQDWYNSDYYSSSPQNNPQGPLSGSSRVLRGGSWYYDARYCRVSNRGNANPDSRGSNGGLRLSL